MSLQAELATRPHEEDGKRRQILDGAMRVFLDKGFDAASMSGIARAASVSKGTLYVYFEDKQTLFDAIVQERCHIHAERVFEFDDFTSAMDFVNAVAEIAEESEHHPDIEIKYNKVKLTLTTHSKGGLTDLDFEVAEKIDTLTDE